MIDDDPPTRFPCATVAEPEPPPRCDSAPPRGSEMGDWLSAEVAAPVEARTRAPGERR